MYVYIYLDHVTYINLLPERRLHMLRYPHKHIPTLNHSLTLANTVYSASTVENHVPIPGRYPLTLPRTLTVSAIHVHTYS